MRGRVEMEKCMVIENGWFDGCCRKLWRVFGLMRVEDRSSCCDGEEEKASADCGVCSYRFAGMLLRESRRCLATTRSLRCSSWG